MDTSKDILKKSVFILHVDGFDAGLVFQCM